jgi:hypothetical protein
VLSTDGQNASNVHRYNYAMNVAAILDREGSYPYDKNGNVTEVGTTTFYTYDFDNRLTSTGADRSVRAMKAL